MLSSHIVHRYLASVNPKTGRFYIDADVRFRPPTDMWEGVWKGEKDPKVLLIWKMCVEKIQGDGRTPSDKLYGAALAYWRNKIKKEGLDLPLPAEAKTIAETKYGPFQIKRGDDIDEWVKNIRKLLTDPKYYAEISNKSKLRAKALNPKHQLTNFTMQLNQLFQKKF